MFQDAPRQDLQAHIAQIRPWGVFFDRSHVRLPKSVAEWKDTAHKNLIYFRMNYAALCAAVFCVNVLFRPSFFVGLCIIAFAWYMLFTTTNPLQVGNHTLSQNEKLGAFAFVSSVVLWFFSVGVALFWIVGISSFLVLAHTSVYEPVQEVGGFEKVFGEMLDA
eukprot:TRINITY_DN66_c0_g5_i1.p1 TRINITY_DN66_c0_g5~~TRINITY_DN66_c0_g5_i1.p1  ORF type:complete len:163 (-),score=31.48 TRINITY_DN66_c0_g5_i1:377-865(-)